MRHRRLQPAENHDRWLVSYADFITLLFAFFVVMFASTQTDKSHAKAISESVQRALKNDNLSPKFFLLLGGAADDKGKGNAMMHGPGGEKTVKPQPPVEPTTVPLADSLKTLNEELAGEISKGSVHLSLESRGLVIGLQAAAFFPSGGDTIDPPSYPTIEKVAAVLNRLPNALRLEGHTDSLPISTPRFHNNWELSAARSIAMLLLLNEHFDVDPQRMAVIGFADNASIDSNDTEEGRGRNRRVDIVILTDSGLRAEPKASRRAAGKQDFTAPIRFLSAETLESRTPHAT